MELREPKRKRRVRVSMQQPFPILNKDGISGNIWQMYTGKYSGDFVVVDAPDDMVALHTMGFFGKGSLSRAGPQFGKERQGVPYFIRQRQWERRCEWAKQQKTMIADYNRKHEESLKKISSDHDTAIASKDTENDVASVENEIRPDSCSDVNVENKNNSSVEQPTNSAVTASLSEKTECTVDNVKDSDNTSVSKSIDVVNTDDEIITLDSTDEDNACATDKISTKSGNIDNKNKKETSSDINEVDDGEQKRGIKRKKTEDIESDESKINSTVVDLSENCTTEEELVKSSGSGNQERLLMVLPDSDSDDEGYLTNVCPRLEKDIFPIHETLHLTLEEAFFLSYGLGCLQVIDVFGSFLALDDMWQLFCKSKKDFIPKYVTYHYFRSKGWIVKPGIKFGSDFLLYKQGPPFYHASYIVVTEVVDRSTWTRVPGVRRMSSWTRVMGLNRLAESVGKEILVCHVLWPSDASSADLEYPSVLSKFQVHEMLIRRWISSQEREENDI